MEIEPRPMEPPSKSRPTVFFLPGLFGDQDPVVEEFLAPVRAHLNLVPVTYFDWAGHIETDCDFAVLAAHVLAQIEARAPDGPVRMAGYSLGGHLVFATALALEAKGRKVESLAILDAPLDFGSLKGGFGKKLQSRIAQILRFNLRGGLASVISKCLIREPSWPVLRRLIPYRNTPLPFHFEKELDHKLTMQLVRRIYHNWWQRTLAEAAPLKARWNLFRSQEHEAYESEGLGWEAYCSNLKVIHVAGTHRGMLAPSINGPLRSAFVEALSTGTGPE